MLLHLVWQFAQPSTPWHSQRHMDDWDPIQAFFNAQIGDPTPLALRASFEVRNQRLGQAMCADLAATFPQPPVLSSVGRGDDRRWLVSVASPPSLLTQERVEAWLVSLRGASARHNARVVDTAVGRGDGSHDSPGVV